VARSTKKIDAMILKIFSPKIKRKNWHFLVQNFENICKKLVTTLFFLNKNANFFPPKMAEKCDHNRPSRFFVHFFL
jgi:hypothetical protein